jgi:acetylornithine/succinyldiaminopimelate/putrescine aminotransferase
MPAQEDVFRITPPLVITQQEIDWVLEKIRMVMC